METKLDWVEAGQRLTNFLKTIDLELKFLMVLTGAKNCSELDKDLLRALDYSTAAITGTKLIGYDKTLPMWAH
jgi:isopentenyl diphosphate isomerase/L-lactate dehydrogenase-like FMN-dependent dehydrogenase